ncbi:hypothetical protein ACJMK2_042036 [Sinanodonta woodiana]|uniref:G-protein coupled receptors family 1 profile domain-containing protein n=1 Tax=Sinanodonta woodiana TaxID=1069815 RepID=A0ABD3W7X5_SINWO
MEDLSTETNGNIIYTDVSTIQMRLVNSNTVSALSNTSVNDSLGNSEDLDTQLISVLLPMTIFIAVESSVGLVGNILILYIYSRKYSICNFRYFVLFLAFVDLTSCLTALPGEIYVQINWYTMQLEWICKIKSYFNVLTVWGSGQIIFLMALDRYKKICRPLGRQIPSSLARKLGIGTILTSSIAALPVAFLWGKQTYVMHYQGLNFAVSICEKSDQYKHTLYPAIYIIISYSIPVGVLMLAAATFNILVVRTVFCNLENVQDVDVSKTDHAKVTNEVTDSVRGESNSLQRENKEISAANPQRYVEISSICRKSESILDQSFNKFLDIREFLSNKIIVPEIKDMDLHRTSTTDTHEIGELENTYLTAKCLTQLEDNIIQLRTDTVSGKSDVDFRSEQILSCEIKNMTRRNTDSVHKTTIKSVISTLENDKSKTASKRKNKKFQNRLRRKTIIMLILTSVFVVTTVTYNVLISVVAKGGDFLHNLSNIQKVFFFFFLRLYFINSAINPILYGILDPRFRQGLKTLVCSEKQTG